MTWSKVVGAVAIAGACAQQASAQQLGGGEPLELPFARLALGLILCSVVAFIAVAFIRKRQGAPFQLGFLTRTGIKADEARRIRVLESQRISTQADVCRFVSGGTEYLVLVGPGGTTVLRETAVETGVHPDSDSGVAS